MSALTPMSYFDLIAIWILLGLLAAGFYVACARAMTKHLRENHRRRVFVVAFIFGVAMGPLGLIAVTGDMLRRKVWYGWTLW